MYGRLHRSLNVTDFGNHEPWIERLTTRITENYITAVHAEITQNQIIIH